MWMPLEESILPNTLCLFDIVGCRTKLVRASANYIRLFYGSRAFFGDMSAAGNSNSASMFIILLLSWLSLWPLLIIKGISMFLLWMTIKTACSSFLYYSSFNISPAKFCEDVRIWPGSLLRSDDMVKISSFILYFNLIIAIN